MVDLPMPGSPPIKTAEPLTSPPPKVRSSSPIPVGIRNASLASTSMPTQSIPLPFPVDRPLGVACAPASSTMEFHAPQASHFPAHLGCTDPQDWQIKLEVGFAMVCYISYINRLSFPRDGNLTCNI